jgi:undecaprenyl diphosphate synthase
MILRWIQQWRSRAEKPSNDSIIRENIPHHVAVIMDGNGRWAKKRGLPRIAGHREGMKTVKEIVRSANELGIGVLTLYAFSTENWKRPKQEVEFLMKLPEEYILSELQDMMKRNIRVQMMGKETGLPESTLRAIREAQAQTSENQGMIVNFALNYGSRDELIQTMRRFALEVKQGKRSIDEIDERAFSSELFTSGLPDPDLLIRTSGEIRLSNFMLWQLAYTELWFTDVLWPDFSTQDLHRAIQEYQRRARRYGAV